MNSPASIPTHEEAMPDAIPDTIHPRFAEAVAYAAIVHADQLRKGTTAPYLCHLLQVAGLVIENGGDHDTQLAAVLHDAAEDRGGRARLADIRLRFGDRVAVLVESCSDSLGGSGQTKAPWKERKLAYIAHLATADAGALLISLADKIHNARTTAVDLVTVGPDQTWSKFKAGRDGTIWYLGEVLAVALKRQAPVAMVVQLEKAIAALEAA
jgi:(p)ppGpp synthase/HD superfamily hydrolase